jgi:hypothetical protein
MRITERDFRIAAAAAVFGFFLCYFLFGHEARPHRPSSMVVIATISSNAPNAPSELPGDIRFQLNGTNRLSPGFLPMFGIHQRPELPSQPPRPNVDLFSSRYKAEIDLRDLQ